MSDKTVIVLDLATGDRYIYVGIPAVQAVINTYMHDCGNNNTWQYPSPQEAMVEYGSSGRTVFCGRFGAML